MYKFFNTELQIAERIPRDVENKLFNCYSYPLHFLIITKSAASEFQTVEQTDQPQSFSFCAATSVWEFYQNRICFKNENLSKWYFI